MSLVVYVREKTLQTNIRNPLLLSFYSTPRARRGTGVTDLGGTEHPHQRHKRLMYTHDPLKRGKQTVYKIIFDVSYL